MKYRRENRGSNGGLNSYNFYYTPKKGSWLNMAEIELSALSKQCLDRRIGRLSMLADEVHAWEQKEMQFERR